jgi:hypothetical protein
MLAVEIEDHRIEASISFADGHRDVLGKWRGACFDIGASEERLR